MNRHDLPYTGIVRLAVVVSAVSWLAGCASTHPAPVNYAPSSVLTLSGALSVGEFTYQSAEAGAQGAQDKKTGKDKVVASNQIRNTALGNIYIDKDVRVFVRDAVFSELRFVGVRTDGTRLSLRGDIEEFLIDDLGFSVDWTLRIHYQLRDSTSQQVVYESVKNVQRNTAKFINVFGALNETVKLNAEELMKDGAFVATINPGT